MNPTGGSLLRLRGQSNIKQRPAQDSNLESPAPEADVLSIRPTGPLAREHGGTSRASNENSDKAKRCGRLCSSLHRAWAPSLVAAEWCLFACSASSLSQCPSPPARSPQPLPWRRGPPPLDATSRPLPTARSSSPTSPAPECVPADSREQRREARHPGQHDQASTKPSRTPKATATINSTCSCSPGSEVSFGTASPSAKSMFRRTTAAPDLLAHRQSTKRQGNRTPQF